MILLISASSGSVECAAAIEEATQLRTRICSDIAKAATAARAGEYTAIVVDEAGMPGDPAFTDELLRNAGLAIPVSINSGLMSKDRISREIRSALARVERERKQAVRQAEAVLRNDLKGEITGILIAAEVALASDSLSPFVEEKLKAIEHLATRMRGRFEIVQ